MEKNVRIGLLLIVFGIFFLLAQWRVFSGQMFLAFLGLVFLAVYVLMGGRKSYGNLGFLIPGFVLLALAAYSSGQASRHPSLFFLYLSLVFWGVLLLHTLWYTKEDWGARIWPLFPAAGLMLFSGFIYATMVLDWTWRPLTLWNYLVALALIGVGIRFLFKK
jgi:hypothetical protein